MNAGRARPEEAWAQAVIAAHLGLVVDHHDDGSAPSMYDLRVGTPDQPAIAVECVGAVDPVSTAAWNTGPGRGSITVQAPGDWIVEVDRDVHNVSLRANLAELLTELTRLGLSEVHRDELWQHGPHAAVGAEMSRLRVAYALRSKDRVGTGRVHFAMTGEGGAIDSTGESVPRWTSEFLASDRLADVRGKLAASGAPLREVFVIVALGGAPWVVESYFQSRAEVLPAASPVLPDEVTGVWLSSEMWGNVIRFDGTDWQRVDAS